MSNLTGDFYQSEGWHGYGCQLEVGDGASPESYQAVAYVVDITPGAMDTAVLERTHLRSPGAHREKLAGLRDSGAFVITGRWVPTDESQKRAGSGSGSFLAHGGLLGMQTSRREFDFKIVLADGSPATEWPFRGIVNKFQPGKIGDAVVDFTAEITPIKDSTALLP